MCCMIPKHFYLRSDVDTSIVHLDSSASFHTGPGQKRMQIAASETDGFMVAPTGVQHHANNIQ